MTAELVAKTTLCAKQAFITVLWPFRSRMFLLFRDTCARGEYLGCSTLSDWLGGRVLIVSKPVGEVSEGGNDLALAAAPLFTREGFKIQRARLVEIKFTAARSL